MAWSVWHSYHLATVWAVYWGVHTPHTKVAACGAWRDGLTEMVMANFFACLLPSFLHIDCRPHTRGCGWVAAELLVVAPSLSIHWSTGAGGCAAPGRRVSRSKKKKSAKFFTPTAHKPLTPPHTGHTTHANTHPQPATSSRIWLFICVLTLHFIYLASYRRVSSMIHNKEE